MNIIEADEFIRKLLKTLESEGIDHYTVEEERTARQRYKRVQFSIKIE